MLLLKPRFKDLKNVDNEVSVFRVLPRVSRMNIGSISHLELKETLESVEEVTEDETSQEFVLSFNWELLI